MLPTGWCHRSRAIPPRAVGKAVEACQARRRGSKPPRVRTASPVRTERTAPCSRLRGRPAHRRRSRGRGRRRALAAARAHLFHAADPQFTGLMAWRGIVPMERLPAELRRPVGSNWHESRRPRRHIPAAARDPAEFCRRYRARRLAERQLDRARLEGGVRRGLRGMASSRPRHHRQSRCGLQMGADRPRPDAYLEQGPRHPPRRRLPSDAALPGPGRHHGHGGRRGAGALSSRPIRETYPARCSATRCSARSAQPAS